MPEFDEEVDLLVGGSGAAAMSAAIAAKNQGLTVLIVESTDKWGGTTSISGGGLWFWRPDQQNSIHAMTLPSHARDLALHPDGRRLAVPCFDGAVRIYELS